MKNLYWTLFLLFTTIHSFSSFPSDVILKPVLNTDQERLHRPLWFGEVPGKPGSFLALEQFKAGMGRIVLLNSTPPNSSTRKTIHEVAVRTANEEGLLGFAFHPKFTENSKYYIYYTPKDGERRGVIEERLLNPLTLEDKNTGRVILSIPQPASNHNGGCLQFGLDGYLYIGLGDGGSWGDRFGSIGNGQDSTTLLGSILRIDVDSKTQGLEYNIPQDNPFYHSPSGRKEIYAYGLRNPWRFSVDPNTGLLWVGDVGQGKREEISIVQKGQNLGWRKKEGFACYNPSSNCSSTELTDPIIDLERTEASSITGGYVFRGKITSPKSSAFLGAYIFGDYNTKHIWAFKQKQPNENTLTKIAKSPQSIASFGTDLKGNIYVVGHGGTIYLLDHVELNSVTIETPKSTYTAFHSLIFSDYQELKTYAQKHLNAKNVALLNISGEKTYPHNGLHIAKINQHNSPPMFFKTFLLK